MEKNLCFFSFSIIASLEKSGSFPIPVEFVETIEFPEIIVGLVGPIGVNLEFVQHTVDEVLKGFGYRSSLIKITDLMMDINSNVEIDPSNLLATYASKIDYANDLRKNYKTNNLLAALAISAISRFRKSQYGTASPNIEQLRDIKTAYIIRQLKTPEEVKLLRTVYGKQFILVSIYGNALLRENTLVSETRLRSRGSIEESTAKVLARLLIERDEKEELKFGQNVSDTFFQGDLFVDLSNRQKAATAISRFFDALFGNNEISPTHDEYGMYLAKSASLRSSDLSRQIGAALFSKSGEIISLGSNEVPKAGGGTYWTEDEQDDRDMRLGHDPNELGKTELFSDLLSRLFDNRLLSDDLMSTGTAQSAIESLLDGSSRDVFKKSKIMNVIEFGRIIHAEMSAITDAARTGSSTKGGTLFCTAFPCHICAKHIVASGIRRVVYLEPYPKSYAAKLHGDSINVDQEANNKVSFVPFMGIRHFVTVICSKKEGEKMSMARPKSGLMRTHGH